MDLSIRGKTALVLGGGGGLGGPLRPRSHERVLWLPLAISILKLLNLLLLR